MELRHKLKTYFNWSSGKDASLALYKMQQDANFTIDRLVTSINQSHERVSMHGLRKELLLQQASALELPISLIELPEKPTMEVYEKKMIETVGLLKKEGFTHAGFGDIFLEDLRKYREDQLKPYAIQCQFPLWKNNTMELLEEFWSLGFKAIIVSAQSDLGEDFVGCELDESLVRKLPKNVDPCGEHGEFHTFCFDGPIFTNPIQYEIGEKIYREYPNPEDSTKSGIGFWFCDLLPQ